MPVSFVHVSDIHFGQERGSDVVIQNDVKERLVEDAAELVRAHGTARASGILVTGDVAYSGKREEYARAGEWLDNLATSIRCEKTEVQLVPGNHDIDRDAISEGCKLMLDGIKRDGEKQLDAFLEDRRDREVFYGRFGEYRLFAEGYDCPLDRAGGNAGERKLEIAPGRTLRFIGLNSALACSNEDEEGELLLGARQHVLPRHSGEELVVLSHHPLHWLQDSDDAREYIRSRARVFICGHEHRPSVKVEEIEKNCDLLMLSAGAAAPPKVGDGYNFTYNLLIFDWDPDTDAVKVTIVPRSWSPQHTRFEADSRSLGSDVRVFVLGCPNFRSSTVDVVVVPHESAAVAERCPEKNQVTCESDVNEGMLEKYKLVLLLFFRDLTPSQRLSVLGKLGALPNGWEDPLTQNIERQLFDALVKDGRLVEIEQAINNVVNNPIPGKEK